MAITAFEWKFYFALLCLILIHRILVIYIFNLINRTFMNMMNKSRLQQYVCRMFPLSHNQHSDTQVTKPLGKTVAWCKKRMSRRGKISLQVYKNNLSCWTDLAWILVWLNPDHIWNGLKILTLNWLKGKIKLNRSFCITLKVHILESG